MRRTPRKGIRWSSGLTPDKGSGVGGAIGMGGTTGVGGMVGVAVAVEMIGPAVVDGVGADGGVA